MSVYKEFFYILGEIEDASVQIFGDAADFGAPTKRGDFLWGAAKQLIEWYGVEGTRKEERYSTGYSVSQIVSGLDEFETGKEEQYRIDFVSCNSGKCKGYDGMLTVTPLGSRSTLDRMKFISNHNKQFQKSQSCKK